jgi:hypothetical protein
LTLPATVSAAIDGTEPVYNTLPYDSFCVALAAGQKLTVETTATAGDDAIGDTFVALTAPSGALVTYDDDSGSDFYSRLEYVAPAAGTYAISVFGLNSLVTGSYQISASAQ